MVLKPLSVRHIDMSKEFPWQGETSNGLTRFTAALGGFACCCDTKAEPTLPTSREKCLSRTPLK